MNACFDTASTKVQSAARMMEISTTACNISPTTRHFKRIFRIGKPSSGLPLHFWRFAECLVLHLELKTMLMPTQKSCHFNCICFSLQQHDSVWNCKFCAELHVKEASGLQVAAHRLTSVSDSRFGFN